MLVSGAPISSGPISGANTRVVTGTPSGDITASGLLSITGAADLDALGTLTAAGALSITGTADLDATGTLAAAGALSITGTADLDALGALIAAGALSINGTADLDATGSLSATGSLVINGAADLTSGAVSDISASGTLSISGVADLDATGSLSASGLLAINGLADLDALGSLVAVGALSINGVADLTDASDNDLVASGALSINGAANLTAIGQMSAIGELAIFGFADLTSGVVVEAPSAPTPAGRSKRRRRRYVIEIDGQEFEVDSVEEAEALLIKAKALAQDVIEGVLKREVKRARRRKRAISVPAPVIASPDSALQSLVSTYRAEIEALYQSATVDAEIRRLIQRRLADEQDEEDAVIALLLH